MVRALLILIVSVVCASAEVTSISVVPNNEAAKKTEGSVEYRSSAQVSAEEIKQAEKEGREPAHTKYHTVGYSASHSYPDAELVVVVEKDGVTVGRRVTRRAFMSGRKGFLSSAVAIVSDTLQPPFTVWVSDPSIDERIRFDIIPE